MFVPSFMLCFSESEPHPKTFPSHPADIGRGPGAAHAQHYTRRTQHIHHIYCCYLLHVLQSFTSPPPHIYPPRHGLDLQANPVPASRNLHSLARYTIYNISRFELLMMICHFKDWYFVADSFIMCVTLSRARSKLAQYPNIGNTVAHSRNVIRGANNTYSGIHHLLATLQRLDCRFSIDARRVIGGRTVKGMCGHIRVGFGICTADSWALATRWLPGGRGWGIGPGSGLV